MGIVIFLQGVNFTLYEALQTMEIGFDIFLLKFVIFSKSNNRWVYFLVSYSSSSDISHYYHSRLRSKYNLTQLW